MGNRAEFYQPPVTDKFTDQSSNQDTNETTSEETVEKGTFSFRLEQLAYARSGDKGNNCNIGEWQLKTTGQKHNMSTYHVQSSIRYSNNCEPLVNHHVKLEDSFVIHKDWHNLKARQVELHCLCAELFN